ncbi:MAG TPA: transglutaminase-like domain-containing protein [Kofleriaceae bacterium]|nr:transglutaminase-like domain-containing protein [Kofleriaceae bacterium]
MTEEPFRGAPHTVASIKDCALAAQHYYPLRLLAEDIVGRIGSKDYLSEILAIYYWVLSHARYSNDPRTIELVRAPRELLPRLQANVNRLRDVFAKGSMHGTWKPSLDCDDLTCLLAALFLIVGREVRIVTVAFKNAFFAGKRQYQHVYLQVREPRTNRWIVLDPVAADTTGQMLGRVVALKIWPIA